MECFIFFIYHIFSLMYCLFFGLKLKTKNIIRFPVDIKGGEYISIGKNSFIGKNSRLFTYDFNGRHGSIIIGENFCAQRNLTISSLGGGHVRIGNDVLISSDVLIIDNDHVITPPLTHTENFEPFKFGTVEIGNNVWIAEKAVILRNVKIGDYCIIGAGSIVTKDIPPYSMAVGNPARIIKKWNFEKEIWEKIGEK